MKIPSFSRIKRKCPENSRFSQVLNILMQQCVRFYCYPDEVEIAARNLEGLVTDGDGVLVFAYAGVVGGEAVQEGRTQTRAVLLILLQPVAFIRRAAVERGAGTAHSPLLATGALLQSHWRCISLYRIFD